MKAIREEIKLNQREFAELVGLKASYYYQMEKGNSLTEGVSFLVGAFMRGNKPLVLLGEDKNFRTSLL